MKLLRLKRPVFSLLFLVFLSCSSNLGYDPTYIDIVGEYGARPLDNLVAVEKSNVSDIQVYTTLLPPTEYIRRWHGLDLGDIYLFGLLPGLILETRRKIDPEFDQKMMQYTEAMAFKPHHYFKEDLDHSLSQRLKPPITIIMHDSSFEDALSIPIFSFDKPPGIVILPPTRVYQPPGSKKALLAFVSLQFYFVNVGDTKFTQPALRMQGNGSLAVCSVRKFKKYMRNFPMLKEKMLKEVPRERYRSTIYLDRDDPQKELEEFDHVLRETKALDGFYIETFSFVSQKYDADDWLNPDKKIVERELKSLLSAARFKVSENLAKFFGK
jgi:hypothetical protein